MNYKVELTENFKKEAKKLTKKYPSLKSELYNLISELEINPKLGQSLGKDIYKIRISIASKNKGKSGGGRIISCLKIKMNAVILLSIYDKSDQDSISMEEIQTIIDEELL